MLPEDPLTTAWMVAVLVNSLKLLGLAQATGVVRMLSGSFAAREDFELMRATYGDVPKSVDDPFATPTLRRLHAMHRNEIEHSSVFFALSYAYVLTNPPLGEARALLTVFTVARLLHSLLYACGATPWRSLVWGCATQALLIMAGRVAAWLLPAAAIGLQVVINAPIALQWLLSLGILGTVREQRRRYERYEKRGLRVEPAEDESGGGTDPE